MDLNFLKLIYFLTEINLLKICFSLMTLFMIVGGGLMNSIEHCLPIFFKQTFRFGKFAYQGEPSQLAPIEVPKRWFRHFYVFAAAYTSIITLVTFQLYFVSGTFTLSPAFSFALDLLASDDRTVKVSAVSCFLSLCLLTIHSWHRLYETWFISVFSDSRINILHYAVGYAHYIGAVAAILAESPGFTDTKDLNAVFSLKDITLRDIYGCGLFLWACYHQYRSTVILANLRKNKKGKIVTHHHGIPYGGWFELVSSPHLLAEVIMYLALTIILWGAHTWPFIFLWVLSNQVESALLTHWWYLSKFEDYPKQRKSIIPYVL